MASRGPYRWHSTQFKIQICSDIRSGKLGRREALKTHNLSANFMQMWLGQFDRGELDQEDAAATTVAEHEAHIAALERKVGQLTMELDLFKKHHGYDSSATARTHRSSAAPSLLHPTRMPNDQSAA